MLLGLVTICLILSSLALCIAFNVNILEVILAVIIYLFSVCMQSEGEIMTCDVFINNASFGFFWCGLLALKYRLPKGTAWMLMLTWHWALLPITAR